MKTTRKKTGKRLLGALLSAFLLFGNLAPVFAEGYSQEAESEASSASSETSSASSSGEEGDTVLYEVPDMTMTIRLPKDAYVFEKDSLDLHSPDLINAGIADTEEFLRKFDEYGTYLVVVTKDRELQIDISKKMSNNTQSVFDLGQISEEEFQEFLTNMRADEESLKEQNITMSVEAYEHPANPFFITDIQMETDRGQLVSELCYGTIVNGYTIYVDGVVTDGEMTQEQRDLIRQITDSIQITQRLDRSEAADAAYSQRLLVWVSVGVLVAIILLAVWRRQSLKKREYRRRMLADRLSKYHFAQQDREEEMKRQGITPKEPEPLFRNATVYTEDAAKNFVRCHILKKQLLSFILFGILGIVFFIMGIFLDVDFFNRVLLLAVPVLVILWETLLPGKLRKAHIAVFRKAKNKTNEYLFREEDFRVFGIQSSAVYPYFQITGMTESKKYFFLYFGDDMAYYVDKSGFTQGSAEDFRQFIQKRIEKNRL